MSRAILARRAEEQMRARNVANVKEREAAMNIAKFEHRTQAKIDRRVASEKVAAVQRSMAADLNRRRERLAEMLSEEDAMYAELLDATFEKPAQRKERLFAKAKALRAAREARRRELVAKIDHERWREMSDDLRTLDAEAIASRCARDRLKQLEEAEQKRHDAYEAEQKAAADWEVMRQRKIAREVEEARQKKERDDAMRLALDQQVAVRDSLVAAERAEESRSAKEMLALWDAQKRAEEAKIAAAKQAEIDAAARVRVENEEFARVRAIESAKEAELDRARLQAALEREAAAAAQEQAEARERRAEAVRYRKHLEAQAAMEKEEQGHLDAMYMAEQEKMWKKRQDQWDREENARQRLMAEVDRSRQQQMALKKALAQAERRSDEASAARIREELAEAEAEDKRRAEEHRSAALEHQVDLLAQIKLKEEQAARAKQAEFLEYKLMQRAEERYKGRLRDMKAKGAPEKNHRRRTQDWYS